jgi:hypothetical protein
MLFSSGRSAAGMIVGKWTKKRYTGSMYRPKRQVELLQFQDATCAKLAASHGNGANEFWSPVSSKSPCIAAPISTHK